MSWIASPPGTSGNTKGRIHKTLQIMLFLYTAMHNNLSLLRVAPTTPPGTNLVSSFPQNVYILDVLN